MTTPNDGGPAFPVHCYVNSDGETFVSEPTGMSLRDYFAAKAMQAIVSTSRHSADGTGVGDMLSSEYINSNGQPVNPKGDRTPLELSLRWVPPTAYAFADAMLAARGKK